MRTESMRQVQGGRSEAERIADETRDPSRGIHAEAIQTDHVPGCGDLGSSWAVRVVTNKPIEERIYFVALPSNPDEFVGINHGEDHCHATTVYDQMHADELNRRQGIDRALAEAALMCSMFDNWPNLDKCAGMLRAKPEIYANV